MVNKRNLRGVVTVQDKLIMDKFEELHTEIAELKVICKNNYTETMRIRDWKEKACTDVQPCFTSEKLKGHLMNHTDKQANFKWVVGLTISFVTALFMLILNHIVTRIIGK
jgi:hypothetical protein